MFFCVPTSDRYFLVHRPPQTHSSAIEASKGWEVGSKGRIKPMTGTKKKPVSSNHSVPARNMRKTDLAAVILGCTHNTINECLSNKLFGLPALHYSYIKNITEGLPLFLFNYSDRKLHGIFEAASHGQMNIDRYAWVADGDGYTSYPAQVRVCVRLQCHPLSENQFQPIIANNYYDNKHFYFELDNDQTNKLIALFQSSPVNNTSASSSQFATRRNNLSCSLPAPAKTKRQADNTIQPTVGMEISDENLSQTSKLSYSSILSRNKTSSTATATSSHPIGNWSGLFKGQSSYEATTNEFPLHQEYDDDANFLEVNTWEESQPIATATEEADHVQSWVADPSSSSQPLDGNPDCEKSLSNEENESGVEEKDDKSESLVPHTVAEISSDLEPLVVKEVEVLKGSQLKQIVKVNRLEQELGEAKLEIQWLRKRLDGLEFRSPSTQLK
ncbi:hypothetical protein L6452_12298 [Arctium lappa]|uniref:Uncharacterized protein n=1 Tax=Arctium lappa TaxID=4217 RepID=A0ACB9DR44_ARCLA|nr:hypothetical protein L6452_12298 [Arctium lappa]